MADTDKPVKTIRDLRDYARQTHIRLIFGGIILLLIVGLGLVYIFYGSGAVFSAFLCIVAGIIPIVLIYISFLIIDWIVKRNR